MGDATLSEKLIINSFVTVSHSDSIKRKIKNNSSNAAKPTNGQVTGVLVGAEAYVTVA